LRALLYSTIGVDIAIFPAYANAQITIASAERVGAAVGIPFYVNTLTVGISTIVQVSGYRWDFDADAPKSPPFFTAKPLDEFSNLLQLPRVAGVIDGPSYAYELCDDVIYPIVAKNVWPDDWASQLITGYDDMKDGPHKWVEIGDWNGRLEFDISSDLEVLRPPSLGVPKNTADDNDGIWPYPEAGRVYEFWLTTTYQGLFPFVLKFGFRPPDAPEETQAIADFRCCDNFDCFDKYSGQFDRSTCGFISNEIAAPGSGRVGDCLPPCSDCDESIDCPGSELCYWSVCTDQDGEGVGDGVCSDTAPVTFLGVFQF